MADYTLNDASRGLKWGSSTYGTTGGTVRYSFVSLNLPDPAFNFTSQLATQMQEETRQAFAAWSAVANIRFELVADSQVTNTGGIRIGNTTIDGAGGTEALTRRMTNVDATIKAAQIGIDTGEGWTVRNGKVYDSAGNPFYHVILHEIGHAIGLNHYDGGPAIMNTVVDSRLELQASDVHGIQYIYGSVARPDLYATGEGLSLTSAHPGDALFVNGRVGNAGGSDAASPKLGFYLSSDSTITTADRFLGELTLSGGVAANSSGGYSTQITLPNTVSPGTYYIGFIVDYDARIAESNESNNATIGSRIVISNQETSTPGLNNVFRFYDTRTGDHFYTTSLNEKQQIQQTLSWFNYEGAQWQTPDKAGGTLDVFRFFDTGTNTHFYTTSAHERDQVINTAPAYHYEGVAFQAYASESGAGAGALTLERFYNTQTGLHHFAANAEEAAGINRGAAGPGWVDEGRGFIVHTPTDGMLHV